MAETLIPLRSACGFLDTEKVNERKKQIEAVKKELHKHPVQLQLDRNKDAKRKFSWNEVFKSVWTYILREIELLKGKGTSSARSSGTNTQRKREVQSTLRYIISTANKRGPNLCCSTLVKNLLSLLKDEFSRAEFGADCCSILTKEVLGCQKYWYELNNNTWIDLIKTVTVTLHNTPAGVTSDLQAKALQCLVAGATVQGTLPSSHLIKFFSSMLKKLRNERSATVISCVVSALNAFSLHVAPGSRRQVCRLGEDGFKSLIITWRTNPTPTIRDELVQTFRILLALHHPRGVMTEEEGAYAVDFDQWKGHVSSLYQELVEEWKQQGTKLKLKGSGKREISQEMVDLAADVCHQVFKAGSVSFEVTQTSSQMTPRGMSSQMNPRAMSSQMTTPAKRRRLESGWEFLREQISQPAQHAPIIPWLRLIESLIRKYPKDIPGEELQLYLSTIHNLQAQNKRGQLQVCVLRCLQCLCVSQTLRGDQDLSLDQRQVLARDWAKVWTATIRTICLHSAEDEGFDLLTSLVHHGIVTPDKETWKLFIPDVTRPSRSSLVLLSTLLTSRPLPESHVCQVGLLASSPGVGKGQYPLRHQLLNWLLPAEEAEEAGERLVVIPKILKSVPTCMDHLAHILTTLCSKNCRGLPALNVTPYTISETRFESRLRSIEDLYLRASFHTPLGVCKGGRCGPDGRASSSTRGVTVKKLLDAVLERLGHVSKHLTESHCKEVDHYESLGHVINLMSKVLSSAISYSEETARDLIQCTLKGHFKILVKRLAAGFKELTQKTESASDGSMDRTHSLTSLAAVLLPMYECRPAFQREGEGAVAPLLRSLSPPDLLDLLLEVVHNKGSSHKSAAKGPGHDLFGESMDLGSDDEFPGTQAQSDLDDDFGEVTCKTAVNGAAEKKKIGAKEDSTPGTHSMLSAESLSREEHLAISCAQVLSAWCWSGDTTDKYQVTSDSAPGVNRASVAQKLLEIFEGEDWEQDWVSTPFGVQLFFGVASRIKLEDCAIRDEELNLLLIAWRSLVSANRKAQEVCVEALRFLQAVIPRLVPSRDGEMVSSDLKECREMALFLMAAFWQLQSTYSTEVRLQMVLCMEALVKADPHGRWAAVASKSREKGQGDAEESSKVKSMFPSLLKDGAHEVRMLMSSSIGCLFYTSPKKPQVRDAQNHTFDVIYETMQEAMELPDNLSEAESSEETSNRTTSLLLTLVNIALNSYVCEKKTIFALLQTTRINNIPVGVMKMVLGCMAERLPYCSTGPELAELHLGYLVHQWLQESYDIREFPFSLLQCASYKDFLSKHHLTIVPHLVGLKQLDVVRAIGEVLGQDWTALLKASFPRTISSLLPLLAQSREGEGGVGEGGFGEGQRERAAWAKVCLAELDKAIGIKTRDTWIQAHLDSIVVELLTTLYEPCSETSSNAEFMTPCDPEPDPPFFTSYMIRATLDYLTQCHSGGKSLTLVFLLSKTPDSLQKVLLELHVRMSKSRPLHEKRRLLLAYRLFGLLLIRELESWKEKSPCLGGSLVFVLQDLIYTLVHTIQEHGRGVDSSLAVEGQTLVRPCLDVLRHVGETATKRCPDEFSKHVQVILGAVIPLVGGASETSKQALSLVEFLVIDSADKLHDGLQCMNPIPDKPELQRVKRAHERGVASTDQQGNLLAEINHFLMRGGQHERSHTPEGLQKLRQRLASKKSELAMLVSMCAENARDSVLPQLICELVSLCSSNHDNQENYASAVQQAAANCLGEIGAPDLSIIALRSAVSNEGAPYSTAVKAFSELGNLGDCRNSIILHLLKEYLTDSCVDTIAASSQCLKKILATPSGQAFYDRYKAQQIDTLHAYLHPFKSSKKKTITLPSIDCSDEAFMRHAGDESLWQPSGRSHETWLKDLTLALIRSGGVRDEMLRLLEPVCLAKVEFAERVFPYLIHDILLVDNIVYRQTISEQVRAVFTRFTESGSSNSRAPTPMPGSTDDREQRLGQRSIKTLLDTLHYLRTQKRTSRLARFTSWDQNFWLDVDYLTVAKAAQMCQAHFTCLLYSEIWCNAQRMEAGGGQTGTMPSFSQDSVDSVSLGSLSAETGINLQTLLMEAFGSIGEPDSVYGCGAGRLVNTNARIQTYEHEGDWGKALAAYDLQMQSTSTEMNQLGLLQAMQNFGLASILQTYLEGQRARGQTDASPGLAEYQYEAAWRNGIWDLDLEESSDNSVLGYHGNVFTAMSSLRSRDESSFNVAVESATKCLTQCMSDVSMESVQGIYPLLAKLQGLVELQDFSSVMLRSETDPKPVLDKWTSQLPLMTNDFSLSEPTLALRSSLLVQLLHNGKDRHRLKAMHAGIASHLKTQIQWAREAGRYQVAERALVHLKELEGRLDQSTQSEGWSSAMEEAQLFWAKNERTTALHLMKAVTEKFAKSSDQVSYKSFATSLSIHGNWLAETRSQSPNIIMEEYLEKAVSIFYENGDTSGAAIAAYHAMARFADAQYQRIVEYMKSKDYEAKRALMKSSLEKVEKLKAMGITIRDKHFRILDKQSAIDKKEVDSLMEDRGLYLVHAMECYLRCLEASDQSQDTRVFRVCSLWFQNATDDEVSSLLDETLSRIEGRKFLPMMYQLAARMTTKTQGKEAFHRLLNALIERVAAEHPHHALPIILALANANKDSDVLAGGGGAAKKSKLSRSTSGVGDLSQNDKDRMQAAQGMCSRLLRSQPCSDILPPMNRLSDAYIHLAYWDVSAHKTEKKPLNIPSNQPLLRLKSLRQVAMPTLELAVDPSCRYDDVVTIEGFEPTIKLAGGLNLPKILSCRGSDGVKRRQLVKGNDDLRQDAVMQQVFGLVNQLLARNTETKRCKLQIRRYKVVPLCQKTGLLEWCEGTMPIGLYLVGEDCQTGAHKYYRPRDWTSKMCRGKMGAAHQSSDKGAKFREFSRVCGYFQPVFHHFFLERFLDPADWFEKRLSYTRSVATGSIVGYVVGLGDRHVQNILIDCNTAELVHIDLGIAFEQGRNLPTPETVPFRLTRDLVDAMGVAGEEGVFRRCSEKTMEVMHNSREALLTIVEVLLYDPLYTWTMSPARALAMQELDRTDMDETSELNATTSTDARDILSSVGDNSPASDREEVNKVAERVMLRLRQKLGGVEDGVTLSVAGQVSLLIQEARDPKNLSRLFHGWQPWI